MTAMMEPLEHTVARFSKMSIVEIENELKTSLSHVTSLFDVLVRTGRINGNLKNMNTRIEDEIIRTFRENYVR